MQVVGTRDRVARDSPRSSTPSAAHFLQSHQILVQNLAGIGVGKKAGDSLTRHRSAKGHRSAVFFSSFQFVDAQFRPQPIEVVSRHFIIAAGEFDRVVFERFEPIDDLGTALCCFYGGARRLVSKYRDWLIEQLPIVPVETIMNDRAALLYGQVQPGWGRRIACCHALFERLDPSSTSDSSARPRSERAWEFTDKISPLSFNSTLPNTSALSSRKVWSFSDRFCALKVLADRRGPIQFQNVAFS